MKEGILCLGEALVDWIPSDASNTFYEKCPGGAPANVAVGLAKLGIPTGFIGKIGEDLLGRFLKETLADYDVDVSGMVYGQEAKTGLTFVSLDESGDREFDFYIRPSADQFLKESDIDPIQFKGKKWLHVGSISMIHEVSRKTTKKAIQIAKEEGLSLSFDPNVRLGLWESEGQVKEAIRELLPHTDLLKISEEELIFLTGEETVCKGIEQLRRYEIPLIFVTKGKEGSIVFTKQVFVEVPAMKVDAVDTTGAGDAYVAGILYGLHETDKRWQSLTQEELENLGRLASVSGGLASSKKGAMTALPSLTEVKERSPAFE